MISNGTLAGVESFSFTNYWNVLKGKISAIKALGSKIYSQRNQLISLRERAKKVDPGLTREIDVQVSAANVMHSKWRKARDYIDKWFYKWSRAASESTTATGEQALFGLGLLPLILPAWALVMLAAGGLTALAYVATTGISLLKEYALQRRVMIDLENKVITAEQAAGIISAGIRPGFFSKLGAGMGKYLSIGILLGGGYYAYTLFSKPHKRLA